MLQTSHSCLSAKFIFVFDMIWCNCTVGNIFSAFSCNVLTEFQEIIPYAHHKQICAVYPKVHNPWCSICCAFPSETLRCATVRPCITHFGIIKYPQCCMYFICVSYLVLCESFPVFSQSQGTIHWESGPGAAQVFARWTDSACEVWFLWERCWGQRR